MKKMNEIKKIIFLYSLFSLFLLSESSSTISFGTKSKKIEFLQKVLQSKNKVFLNEIALLLEDEDEEVRSLASYVLYEIGDSTCIDYFKKALEDTYWQVRLYGVKGLVKYGDEDILGELISALDDPYWQVRYYGAIGIGKFGDENTVESLIEHLEDENQKVKEAILISLRRLMWKIPARNNFKLLKEENLKSLFDCFKGKENIKLLTISLFESANDRRCIPYLVELLGDESDEVKIKALWVLEKFKSSNIEEIEGLLGEASVKVKIEAIKTIVRLKDEAGLEGLLKGLEDENEMVKIYSLWAIEKFKNPITYQKVVKCLSDKSLRVREEAINLIEKIKDPIFIPIFEKYIEDKNSEIEFKKLCLIELGKIGQSDMEKVKNILKKYLKDSNRELRISAMEGFFYLDKFDDHYLKNLVYMEKNDPDKNIRIKSSKFLKKIVDELIKKVDSVREDERNFVMKKVENIVGSKEANRLFLKMIYSKYPQVKEGVLSILKENPIRIFAKDIKETMRVSDLDIKKLCVAILGEIKDKSSIPILKEGLKHSDSEYKLLCANALAKMGKDYGLDIILRNVDSENPEFQKIAIESLVYLNKIQYSYILLKKLIEGELDIKLISAYGLTKMGNESGLEFLVRLSETNVEPIKTLANYYLQDPKIPSFLKSKIPIIREEIYRSKIGIQEIKLKTIYSFKTESPIEVDGKDNEEIWRKIEEINEFIKIEDEKVPLDIQTKVASVYDKDNIYFFFICENPSKNFIDYDTRDFITISINPKNSFNEWYQFVFHPLCDIKYCYVWKFYKNEDPERYWNSEWKVSTNVLSPGTTRKWIAEVAIPLKDLKLEKIEKDTVISINFQREIDRYLTSTWTGRIDIPEQFGNFVFKEKP